MLARNAAVAALAAALILIPARSSAVTDAAAPPRTETATLAGGCFWCLEAVFQELAGVTRVVSGYAGGGPGPVTYKEVCTGTTGHAEAVQVTFDPAVISYAELLAAFFTIHDPTTPDRQGADVGPQYRSAIFAHDAAQLSTAEQVKSEVAAAKLYPHPPVTRIGMLDAFIPAEADHQDYYANNRSQSYCRIVIDPKLKKFREQYRDRLKQ
ncbi:MAG: peptide-methionine (S)-S-oxide reductase MsrA [bacterium]|nr:peptide-methionine (S)-S-oxide reductase MsrA [bacterium]